MILRGRKLGIDRFWLGVIIVGCIAAILRFYQLGNVPHGMTWDEAAIGYNGFAVITTRRDEWLHFLPISFQSFGDYKAPLAIYITGLFTTLLGMKVWVVRLPFAISGVAAVIGWMLLVRRWVLDTYLPLAIKETWYRSALVLVAGMLLALSPWHLHFTRVGFESGMSLTFVIWGVWAWFELWHVWQAGQGRKSWKVFALAALSAALLAISLYVYHSAKVSVPLLGLGLLVVLWPLVKTNIRSVLPIFVIQAVVVMSIGLPLLWDTLVGNGAERFNQASIFTKGWTPVAVIQKLFENSVAHFSPRYLIGGATTTLRHGDGAWGVLFPTTLLLVLTSLWPKAWNKMTLLGSWWIVAGTIPAVISVDAPHSNRMILALPGFLLLAIVGLNWLVALLQSLKINSRLVGSHREHNLVTKSVIGTLVLLYGLCFIAYQHRYYTVFAAESAGEFKDGYLEAFAYVIPYEKGTAGHPEIDKILFTADYGQPYVYALFARRTNPIWYQGGSLVKYEFSDTITVGDLMRRNAVIVASAEDELPLEQADEVIYGSDGQVRFKIYVTQPY